MVFLEARKPKKTGYFTINISKIVGFGGPWFLRWIQLMVFLVVWIPGIPENERDWSLASHAGWKIYILSIG